MWGEYMSKKKRRYGAKTRGRIMFLFVMFSGIIATLCYTLLFNLKQINDLKDENRKLKEENSVLLDKEEAILADIKRLSDSSYVARYVREKYFYSKKGELVLRISD